MPLIPSSALKKFIQELPDDWARKSPVAKNELLRKVKQEELDYSGVSERLAQHDPKTKLTKAELVEWDADRKDSFSEVNRTTKKGNVGYDGTTIRSSDSQSYFENVRQYKEGKESRQISSHFSNSVPDYLSHSRGSVEPIGAKNTRLVQEIQSDLHQGGRQHGYAGETKWSARLQDDGSVKRFNSADELESFMNTPESANYRALEQTGSVPDTPLKKNWARKEIEKEILHAVDEGQEAIAIPLDGAASELSRGVGAQKWYETQVRSTLKKIAKQIPGAEYKEVKQSGKTMSKFDDTIDEENLYFDLEVFLNGQKLDNPSRHAELESRLESLTSADGASPFDVAVASGNYVEALTLLPTDIATNILPTFAYRTIPLDVDNVVLFLESNPRLVEKLNTSVRSSVPDADEMMFSPVMHAQTLARGNFNDELSHALSNSDWSDLYEAAGIPEGITYGQIVLPKSEKVTVTRVPPVPKTYVELRRELRKGFDSDMDARDYLNELKQEIRYDGQFSPQGFDREQAIDLLVANDRNGIYTDADNIAAFDARPTDEMLEEALKEHELELGPVTIGEDDILAYAQAYWDNIKSSANLVKKEAAWPELTPEVSRVIKSWESAPENLAQLNKLQEELPEEYSINLQAAAVNEAIAAKVPNVEELRLAINTSTGIYHSAFGSGNIVATLDDLHPRDIVALPDELRSTVIELIEILNEPEVVVGFVKKYWQQITKEQSFPKIDIEVTPATHKYPEWTKKFELYGASALAIGASMAPDDAMAQQANAGEGDPVGLALDQGASPGAILEHLQVNEGLTEPESRRALAASIQSKIDAAIDKGASPESVQEHVTDLYKPTLFEEGQAFDFKSADSSTTPEEYNFPETELGNWEEPQYIEIANDQEATDKSTEGLISAKENMMTSYQFMMEELVSGFQNEETKVRFNKMRKTNDYAVANTLRSLGRNIEVGEPGEFVEIMPDGTKLPITPEWYSKALWDMAAAEKEIGFAIGGAIVGERLANAIPSLPGKLLGWVARLTGGTLGGGAGAMVGRGLDLAYNSAVLGEELEAEYYKKMMMDAGYWDAALGTTLGVGLAVTGKLIIGMGKAVKMVTDGNRNGAYKFLKDFMHLDDAKIEELITDWEGITGAKAPGFTRATKAMHVIPQTQPGGEAIVASSAGLNPKMSADLARSISARAKDLNKSSANLTTENISTIVHGDLGKYVTKVKDYYTGIKTLGIAPFKGSSYRFTFDKLGIDKVLKKTDESIRNPAVRKRFDAYVQAIDNFSNNRTFANILELRKTLNEFKYNTKLRQHIDWEMINKSIRQVDKEIGKAARKHMPAGDVWLKEWNKANTEYSKMIKLRKNVLFRALTRKGVSPKAIVKSLSNYITSLDGTFMEVVSKLPGTTRNKIEGVVIDQFVKKHTIGFESGIQATHFTNLSDELKQIAFSSPEARKLKRAINEIAKVFKNDVSLSQGTGQIARPKFQSYLTTDPVVRIKYEVASTVFNYVKRLMPTTTGDYIALVTKVAKILEKPADAKTMQQIIALMPNDPEIVSGLHQLALVSAKFGKKENYPKVKVYKSGLKGRAHKTVDGKFGRGEYWSTDKHGTSAAAREGERKVFTEEILPSRIATEADVKRILAVEEITPEMLKNSKNLQLRLKEAGYDGLAIDHDVVLFRD